MAHIQPLDQNTINQIAAGEVVERPASVIKELVENAIDAHASQITVEVKDGGLKQIRVTDNGEGIAKEDIRMAFLRHSTSKIRQADDLITIASLGFRGEALASIAAVSMVELLTKESQALTGSRYKIEGGNEVSLEEVGCPSGTTFIVNDLFYNTPARLKFMKTPSTELGYISDMMNKIAMGHPQIGFKFISNNRVKLQTSGNGRLKDCIFAVYGKEVARNLIEVRQDQPAFRITGFIGKPHISRGNRTYENYYINGRYIKSKVIEKGIEDGFKSRLMQHRYPFVSLHLEIEPNLVDVNVHPTKMEVRFSKEELVYQSVYHVVVHGLGQQELIVKSSLEEPKKEEKVIVKKQEVNEPFETIPSKSVETNVSKAQGDSTNPLEEKSSDQKNLESVGATDRTQNSEEQEGVGKIHRAHEASMPYQAKHPKIDLLASGKKSLKSVLSHDFDLALQTAGRDQMKASEGTHQGQGEASENKDSTLAQGLTGTGQEGQTEVLEAGGKSSEEKPPTLQGEQEDLVTRGFISQEEVVKHKVVGQLFDTYWLVELGDQYYIIDQHAAHEKVLYERLVQQMQEMKVPSQRLLTPMVVDVSLLEKQRFEQHQERFEEMGFEVDLFGEDALIVRSVPSLFDDYLDGDSFVEILDSLADELAVDKLERLRDTLATKACKAAVKGNDRLSTLEYQALIEALLKLEDPFHCPHGRPTIISMTRYELEKKFKRIV